MSSFIRRFREFPSVEVLPEIEAVNVVDIAPPLPTTGVGSGAVLLFGEFEETKVLWSTYSTATTSLLSKRPYPR